MRAPRWKATAALVLVAVEAAALFWAYYALNPASMARGLESDPSLHRFLGAITSALRGAVPSWALAGIDALVSSTGLGRGILEARSLGAVATSWVNTSSIGSAIVAPAYFAARRLLRRASSSKPMPQELALPWGSRPPDAKLLEPEMPASTAVQEPL